MQLVRAYSVFNNNGNMVSPKIVKSLIDEFGIEKPTLYKEQVNVITSATAAQMKRILIKTVNKGTGKKTITPGLEVGGKTGTAYIVEDGQYVSKYNTAFIGFANDKKHKYSLAVVVARPGKEHFASQTAVPVFKKAIDILIEEKYLKPNIVKQPSVPDNSLH